MSLDTRIAQIKALIQQREEIDRQLELLLSGSAPRRRRKPDLPLPAYPENEEAAQ